MHRRFSPPAARERDAMGLLERLSRLKSRPLEPKIWLVKIG